MRKLFCFLMITIILSSTGCSHTKSTYFYQGKGSIWLVTYSITKVDNIYYDSLSIQYLYDNGDTNNIDKIGPIEYQLTGNSIKCESSYPQDLQGIGSFHTASAMNADYAKLEFDKEMNIAIQWQNSNENIILKRMN